MQVAKIREAVEASKLFTKRAEEVLAQSQNASFLLCNGKHATILKKTSNKLMQALSEMRRP